MTRQAISLTIPDISRFARSLRDDLDIDTGHQSVLNAVARAGGYRNFQHLKAATVGDWEPPVDIRAVDRAAARFDGQGRLVAWPSRYGLQMLCLWPLWAQLPPRESMTERQVSARLDLLATFGDAARLRREMVTLGLMTRTVDGSDYRRVERRPGPTERQLISRVVK